MYRKAAEAQAISTRIMETKATQGENRQTIINHIFLFHVFFLFVCLDAEKSNQNWKLLIVEMSMNLWLMWKLQKNHSQIDSMKVQ